MAPQTRLVIRTVAITLCVLAFGGALAAYAFMMTGFYNIGATTQHWQPVYSFLETGMHQSVRLHARRIAVPPLDDNMARAGARLYAAHCALCHGAPGVAPSGIGMSMQPVPGPLVDAKDKWRDRELYWIVRHGIKMSGMPAWEFRLADDELWQLVAFVRQMPDMTPADYAKRVQEPPP
ncbi:MAG TPA: cytochrome c [Oxalicibacterium sp.]|nr:cytochrome c [Oxalicibacterium sp.]